MSDVVVTFSEDAFTQLKRFRERHGGEAAVLYNDIVACLEGRRECPRKPARNGRVKLVIGSYRVFVLPTGGGYEVLRVYRAM